MNNPRPTTYHCPGTRFVIPVTDPDGSPIDSRYIGQQGTIKCHVSTVTVAVDLIEEIYEVAYDKPDSELHPLLSHRWMRIASNPPDEDGVIGELGKGKGFTLKTTTPA
ncbi:hypothetical protein GOEFS_119_00060 [Gordonia effusa NBRC 100432]|uniref:Uncharacterized protein n=2 Tax=Gordonia effusa TaxID=263908 RepID=H0R615_9ACTN|nr:hypothetical protein GOEFS_119_00060 [Gordonia effusa NBRC 100432]